MVKLTAAFLKRALRTLCVLILLTGCEGGQLAPVIDSSWFGGGNSTVRYVVKPGDTLYSIAFRYDRDYRALAQSNRLYPPYKLQVGQVIVVDASSLPKNRPASIRQAPPKHVVPAPIRPAPAYSPPKPSPFSFFTRRSSTGWVWPLDGRLVNGFSPQLGKKGINIAGKRGDRIRASRAGVVAYAGNGLNGYGNLLIIKHDNQYLTAYGHNSRLLVREGQSVSEGQYIAEIGMIERRYYGVHFEIRHRGQPINPLQLLPKH